MFLFKNTVLYKLFYPIIILSLITFSCSTDNSITGSTDIKSIGKTTAVSGMADVIGSICFYASMKTWYPDAPMSSNVKIYSVDSRLYNFQDNYLSNSEKGIDYIACYYKLSKYGIENNLVMKHSLEHLSLMNTGIVVSRELQHGTNDSQILINRSTYNDLKVIVKIYRESENHTDIDPVLDYLESDLEKYYNKPKTEIAVDFE